MDPILGGAMNGRCAFSRGTGNMWRRSAGCEEGTGGRATGAIGN